jgi:tetratricopeptide (TPR) repeat protein
MFEISLEFANSAFETTKPNPRANHPAYFVIGLLLASLLAPLFLDLNANSLQGRAVVVMPWLFILALLAISYFRVRKQRNISLRATKAWDAAQLEDWQAVESLLPELLKTPMRDPDDRGRALVLVAMLAEQRKNFDVASHVYERVLRQRIGDARLLQHVQLALAAAKLRNEELVDAIDLLGRLQQIEMPPSFRAIYEAIRLHQQVFMGHYADAVTDLDDRLKLFRRHLSTRAGYAYALLATAFHRLGNRDSAQRFWLDATTLVAPDAIHNRYEVTRDLIGTYAASERPL